MKYNVGTMKYFLVGYMACGKTRRGKVIAEEQGVRFIDLDVKIGVSLKFLLRSEKPDFEG